MWDSIFKKKQEFPIKTFTYFIPSPPKRKTGYQEKEYDELINFLISSGFKIENILTQSSSNSESSGMWVVTMIRPLNSKANTLKPSFNFEEVPTSSSNFEIQYES